MSKLRHVGVIPARKGSKGVPGKNRLMFPRLADFLDENGFFERIVVTSDDEELLKMAETRGYETRLRPAHLAADTSCLKEAFDDMVEHVDFEPDDYLWLLFITYAYRDAADFREAIEVVEKHRPPSLCTFIPAEIHPYTCWRIDDQAGRIEKFIDNDLVNRQEFPPAWRNYNYQCCVRRGDLDGVNRNLQSNTTYPLTWTAEKAKRLLDIDEPKDLVEWKRRYPENYAQWYDSLPEGAVLPKLEES